MELKPRFLSVVVVIFFLTLLIIFGMKSEMDSKVQESSPSLTNRGVVAWLTAFTDKNYILCDMMLEDKSSGLYSYYVTTKMQDGAYYETTLNKLVDSIHAVQIKSIVKDTDIGVTTYTVTVSYDEYLKISDLVYATDSLDEAKEAYENDELTDVEFQDELSRVYYQIFCDSCFQESNAETRQKDLVLSEKEVNGVTCVYGTVSFVDSLLSDSNVTNNIAIYENDVKDKVYNIIKAS